MDIDAAYETIRTVMRAVESASEAERSELALAVAEQWDAIDGWLSRGGFLPRAWSAERSGE